MWRRKWVDEIMSELNIYVGKQAIFDLNGNIYGYELLYRNSEINKFPDEDPEQATVELLVNTFLTIGIDKLVGKSKSFINFSQNTLESGIADQLDPRFVIIEVLEDAKLTPKLIQVLLRLRKRGFKVALDDFFIDASARLPRNLFQAVDMVKVDFLNTTATDRRRIELLVKKNRHIMLVAEKIEDEADYEEARKHGYLLFQGYYFARPEIVKGKEIPPNYVTHFQLIKEFNEEEPNVNQISTILKRDVSLSYKLLRYINSITFDIPNEIHSIHQAVMLMGLRETKRWLRILLLREMGRASGRGKERALIDRSLVRAKVCELLATYKRKKNADEYFLTGLFSLIDIIMRNELERLISQLSLSKEITSTLLGEETEILPYLQLAIALEDFDIEAIHTLTEKIGLDEKTLSKIAQEAHNWAMFFD